MPNTSKNENTEKRDSKFYDYVLNKNLRNLLTDEVYKELRQILGIENTAKFAQKIGVTSEAVRQWTAGYSRPSVDNIRIMSEKLRISTDWFHGLSKKMAADMDVRAIGETTGLSEKAVEILMFLNKSGDLKMCDLVSSLIEDSKPVNLFFKEHCGEQKFTKSELEAIEKEYVDTHAKVMEYLWILLYDPNMLLSMFYENDEISVSKIPDLAKKLNRLSLFEFEESVLKLKNLIEKK